MPINVTAIHVELEQTMDTRRVFIAFLYDFNRNLVIAKDNLKLDIFHHFDESQIPGDSTA